MTPEEAQKEEAEALRRILTPEEVFQYEVRASATGYRMRWELEGFNPTEQEYLAVFKLRKPFEDAFPPEMAGSGTDAEKAKRTEAEKQVKEQIKQTLGAERYALFRRISTPKRCISARWGWLFAY